VRDTSRIHCALAVLLLFVASCASIQPPPGGPEEKTPPAVDTTTPYNRQLNVSKDTKLYFRFDRPVDRASFIQAFSITPYVNGVVDYDWSGYDEVTVQLPELLRDSTTYTVTLGRELKSRRGNNLAEPLRLTFSTGPYIDTGVLAGYVMNPISSYRVPASQVYVFAYDISVRDPDTLDLRQTPPDLITQPADQGAWQFLSMKVGHRYRVYATTDAYRNHLYDLGTDAYGVPAGDVLLDSARKKDFFVRLAAPRDTARPIITDASIDDSAHITVRFTEAIDSNSVRASNFSVAGGRVLGAFRPDPIKRPGQLSIVVDPPSSPNETRHITVFADSITDIAGNSVWGEAGGYNAVAAGSLPTISAPHLVSIGISDSVGNIDVAARIPIRFSDAVDHDVDSAITLTDTAGRSVPLEYHWVDDACLYVRGHDSLRSNQFYTLRLQSKAIKSPSAYLALRSKTDTTFVRRFRTIDLSSGGRLSGSISVADSFFTGYSQSLLVVQLLLNGTVSRELVLGHGDTTFAFDQVPGDRYRVRAYLNKEGGTAYDPGNPYPWRFGVPTGDFPGDIDARPRWEIAKINFEVK
jgi:hypothetical protein